MPTFQYRALQSDGVIAEGEIEAGGRLDAFRLLEGRSLRPIKLAERNGHGAASPAKKAPQSPPKAPARDAASEAKAA